MWMYNISLFDIISGCPISRPFPIVFRLFLFDIVFIDFFIFFLLISASGLLMDCGRVLIQQFRLRQVDPGERLSLNAALKWPWLQATWQTFDRKSINQIMCELMWIVIQCVCRFVHYPVVAALSLSIQCLGRTSRSGRCRTTSWWWPKATTQEYEPEVQNLLAYRSWWVVAQIVLFHLFHVFISPTSRTCGPIL